jgi:hypothetical protein
MTPKLDKFLRDLTAYAKAMKDNNPLVVEPTGSEIADWPRMELTKLVAKNHDLDYCRECYCLVAKGTGFMDANGRLLCETCK